MILNTRRTDLLNTDDELFFGNFRANGYKRKIIERINYDADMVFKNHVKFNLYERIVQKRKNNNKRTRSIDARANWAVSVYSGTSS